MRNTHAQITGGEARGALRASQTVACVDITDEELGLLQDTTLGGTMMMSAKMVEIVQQEVKQAGVGIAKMSAYCDTLSEDDWACLVVAMAEKRVRDAEETPEGAPQP